MATTSAAVRQLSDGNSQGTVLGISSSDLIGFYGVTTCVARQTATSTAVSLAALTGTQTASSGGFGASTAAIMTSTFALVNALRSDVSAIYSALRAYNLTD